jgi:2-polyprenyl-6-methoxyphenol hydroxylase-like FAD-dependent oxidoreductase
MQSDLRVRHGVAVIGSGITGLAASVLLRQERFDVVCLDAHPHPHQKVGESLDWSSPGLLGREVQMCQALGRRPACRLRLDVPGVVCERGIS